MNISTQFLAPAMLASLAVLASAPAFGKEDSSARFSSAASTAVAADPNLQRAVQAVYPALVRVHVVVEQGDDGRMQKQRASGSGTIISPDGYILSNHHVAGRATRITVRLANREELDAQLIGTDPLADLAVLKIDPASRRDAKSPLPFAKFGDSDKLKVGDVVLAMGSPAGLSQSVTKGIVANTEMISPGGGGGFLLDGENVGELVRWIGHDAVIYPGNSGGPLVNLRGEIIGVNEVGIGSLGGAIPSNLAKSVANEIIQHGHVSRSWSGLGVQPLLKDSTSGSGVLVAEVLPDSPASAAGVVAGDLITNYNGTPIAACRAPEDIPVFNRLILATPVGATVSLQGLHESKPASWRLTTRERELREAREVESKSWGVTVRNFTTFSWLEARRKDRSGVLVDSVRPGGPCAESKPPLRRGDIILAAQGKALTNVAAMLAFTKEFTAKETQPKPALISFERDSQTLLTVADIGPETQDEKPARPAKAWLGVQTQVLTSDLAEALQLEGKKGVRVTQVIPDSPAEKAGAKVGDVFLKLDGQVIAASTPSDQELFENLIRAYKVGGEAILTGVRDSQPLTITATLGRQPKTAAELPEYKDDRFEFTAREISLAERVDDKLPASETGLRISAVQNAGWAALSGLSAGDFLLALDGRQVATVAELEKMLKQYRETKPRRVVFFVRRGIHTSYLELEPKW